MKIVLLVLFTFSLFVALNSKVAPEKKKEGFVAPEAFDIIESSVKAFKKKFPAGTALNLVKDAVSKLTEAYNKLKKALNKITPEIIKLITSLAKKLKHLKSLFNVEIIDIKELKELPSSWKKELKKGNY